MQIFILAETWFGVVTDGWVIAALIVLAVLALLLWGAVLVLFKAFERGQ